MPTAAPNITTSGRPSEQTGSDQVAVPDQGTGRSNQQSPPALRPWRGIPHDQRVQQRRLLLLDAGLEVFGTVGARAATVSAVCQQAQLTQRYFYESFPSLRSLLAEVFLHVTKLQQERIAQAASRARARSGDLHQSLRAALVVYYSSLQEDPRLARVQLLEVLGGSDGITERCHQMAIRRAADLVVGQVRQVPGPAVPQLLAFGLIGAVVEIATMWFLDDFAESLEDVVSSALVIFDAVLTAEHTATPKRAVRQPTGGQGLGPLDLLEAPSLQE